MSSFYDDYHRDYVNTSIQRSLINWDNFTYVNFFRYLLPTILDEKPKSILDIGSGAGTISLLLASLGYRVTGIDVSKLAIEESQRSAKYLGLQDLARFVFCDFSDFSSNKKYDIVICLEVIEHTKSDVEFLRKMKSLLISDGLLILSTPLDTAPLVRLGFAKKFDSRVGHLRRYSKHILISLLNSSGFSVNKVIETEGIIRNSFFVIPVLGLIIRFMRSYVTKFFTLIDDLSGKLFGYSDLIIFARKK